MRWLVILALLLLPGGVIADVPRLLGRGAWPGLVKAHQGAPVIVHFWGMTCGPCLTEMPEWGAFRRANPKLPIVLVQADPIVIPSARIDARLAESGLAGLENWVLADFYDDALRAEIDPDWLGEMPQTVMIGRDGRIERFTGEADFATVQAWAARQAIAGK